MNGPNTPTGLWSTIRDSLFSLLGVSGLPPIKGRWYFVDPKNGSNSASGKYRRHAVKDIQTAYAKCVSGAGDGICLLSGGTASADTTSYLKQPLLWTKHAITVVGVSSGTRLFGRSRISNVEVSTGALTDISFTNSGSADTINRVSGSFITDGFEVGQTITVDSTSNTNDGNFTIAAVSALQITLSASDSLTTESAATAGSTTIKSYNANLITVSGDNNAFINVHLGNFSSNVLAVGALKVTGNRNYFENVHLIGAGHATPAASTGAYDLELNGGQENTFVKCTFGTDTIIRAATNGNIRFDSDVWRSRFEDCEILSYSDTSTKGAILSNSATALDGVQVFTRCRFINWNDNGIGNIASAFIGTKPTSGAFLMDSCALVGYTAWDAVAANDMVYVANSAAVASGGGGIATTV